MENLSRLIHFENEVEFGVPNASVVDIDFLFIGELAEKFGLNPKTIRFYEKAGLLEPARHGKFRTYVKADARKLHFILKMRGLGVSIANIKSLTKNLQNDNDLTKTILHDHVENLKQKKIMIEQQLRETTGMLEVLTKSDLATECRLDG
jgi:DNA-binding transcriptional MerR regulator